MGTSIQLTLADVSLDYAKNHMGNDYGFLFQDGDETRRKSDEINYEYYEGHPDQGDLAEHEVAFVRPLARVLPRLALLGQTLDSARAEYQALIDEGRFAAHAKQFERVPWTENSDMYWSESSYLAAKLCILSAPSMLQIFSLNPENTNAKVTWQFGPIVNAGWVNRESFQPGARREQSILIVTEGASDARILRRALDLLRPDVADFFRFIDADERHHF